MDELAYTTSHKLSMTGRGGLQLTGVLDVISFDLKDVLLETADGMLSIKGSDLHMNHLSVDKGEVFINGRIDSLQYTDVISAKATGKNMLERIFK